MSHAERCPVCGGDRTVPTKMPDSNFSEKCVACDGRGWVMVDDDSSSLFVKTLFGGDVVLPESKK